MQQWAVTATDPDQQVSSLSQLSVSAVQLLLQFLLLAAMPVNHSTDNGEMCVHAATHW